MTRFMENIIDKKAVSLLGKEKMAQLLSSIQDLDRELSNLGESEMKELTKTLREKILELAKK